MRRGDSLLRALAAEFARAADPNSFPARSLAAPAARHATSCQYQLSGRKIPVC